MSMTFHDESAGTAQPATPNTAGRTGCLGRLVEIALFVLVVALPFGFQFWSWLGPALNPDVNPAALTAAQAGVTALLLIGFGLGWRGRRERAIYRAWLIAALYPLLMAATRLLPPTASTTLLIVQLGITGVLAAVLYLRLPKPGAPHSPGWMWGATLAAAGLFALPWLRGGALGSLEDALLALGLGLAFGALAALLLMHTWFPSLAQDSRGRGADIFSGGLAAGALLVTLASGLSFNGMQLVLMLALPALGFLAVALAYAPAGYDWRPPALLIGLAAALMLALVDTDALAVEASDPVLSWAFRSALLCVGLGWLLCGVALLWRRRWGQAEPTVRAWGIAAAAVWLLAVVVYAFAGNAGLYPDQYFVILKQQADVSAAEQMADYDARRQYVYDTLVATADSSQADLRRTLDRFGIAYTPYYLVNAVQVNGGLLPRLLLATRPEVDRILPAPRLRPLPEPLPKDRGEQTLPETHDWNLKLLGADRVWNELGVRGKGIVVGQSDSGVEGDHPEVAAAYRGRLTGSNDYAWFDPWSHTPAPVDFGGHGTHTLGTVLGKNTGVAPDATWIACVNLQRNLGDPGFYLDCLQFMLAPFPVGGDPFTDGDPARSANVLNNSWGCPQDYEGCDPDSLQQAVDALRAAGIFVVASAGNSGPQCGSIEDPIATYDAAFTVGAIDRNGNLAPFSSVGPVTIDGSNRPKPDVAAPGMDVWSAYPGGTYLPLDGTSMAGPHVAGVVALLWSANPKLIGDIDRTEQILRETARPFSGKMASMSESSAAETTPGEEEANGWITALEPDPQSCIVHTDAAQRPNNLVGYGIVDAFAAVQRALNEEK